MSKVIRTRMVKELKARLKDVTSGVLVDFRGLDGKSADSFRKELKAANVHVDVLKTSLAVLAFKDMDVAGLEKTLTGMLALVHGPDPADCAKKILAWRDKNKKLEVKGGILEKKALTPAEVKALSLMPDRKTLLAQLASVMQGPVKGFAVASNALMQNMAMVLKAVEEQKAKAGGAAQA